MGAPLGLHYRAVAEAVILGGGGGELEREFAQQQRQLGLRLGVAGEDELPTIVKFAAAQMLDVHIPTTGYGRRRYYRGTNGDDVIAGLGGNDRIDGKGGTVPFVVAKATMFYRVVSETTVSMARRATTSWTAGRAETYVTAVPVGATRPANAKAPVAFLSLDRTSTSNSSERRLAANAMRASVSSNRRVPASA